MMRDSGYVLLEFCFIGKFLVLFYISYCFCYHFKQNLLASGVQSDSDMEELDDEVKACFFF